MAESDLVHNGGAYQATQLSRSFQQMNFADPNNFSSLKSNNHAQNVVLYENKDFSKSFNNSDDGYYYYNSPNNSVNNESNIAPDQFHQEGFNSNLSEDKPDLTKFSTNALNVSNQREFNSDTDKSNTMHPSQSIATTHYSTVSSGDPGVPFQSSSQNPQPYNSVKMPLQPNLPGIIRPRNITAPINNVQSQPLPSSLNFQNNTKMNYSGSGPVPQFNPPSFRPQFNMHESALAPQLNESGPALGTQFNAAGPGLVPQFNTSGPGLRPQFNTQGQGSDPQNNTSGPGLGPQFNIPGQGLGPQSNTSGPGLGPQFNPGIGPQTNMPGSQFNMPGSELGAQINPPGLNNPLRMPQATNMPGLITNTGSNLNAPMMQPLRPGATRPNAPQPPLPPQMRPQFQPRPSTMQPGLLRGPDPSAAPQSMINPPGSMHLPPAPGMMAPPSSSMQAAQPQRRQQLSPDQMPSAVSVQELDASRRSGLYDPNQVEHCPPLVTTDFFCQDVGGNCSPRFIRSSLYHVPLSSEIIKTLGVNFSLSLSPFANLHPRENPLPLSNQGSTGPLRCARCKAYLSPFVAFLDGGRRFQCALCLTATDVPDENFAHLDASGRRVDVYQRPELCLGSYEMTATASYCRGDILPQPPGLILALDVSLAAIKSGLVQFFCDNLKPNILPNLPRSEDPVTNKSISMRVGFVTYDKVIHFYNLDSRLIQPQVQIVSDVTDVFVPLVTGFFVDVDDPKVDFLIDQMIDLLRNQYVNRANPEQWALKESIAGPVIQGCLEGFRANHCSGKIILLHCELPNAEAPGKLRSRDDKKLVGSEKEKILVTPGTNFYTELGQECVKEGVSIDLFLFPTAFVDVASLASVCRLTCGNIFKYNFFRPEIQTMQLIRDLKFAIGQSHGFDAVLRVRTSTGTRPVTYYGNFNQTCASDVDLACVDSRTTITVEIKHDDKLNEGDFVYIQVACLYTSLFGQRRIRVHNLRLPTTISKLDVFKTIELDTIMNLITKESLAMLLSGKMARDVRTSIASRCAQILAAYRQYCAANNEPGELVLPEQMKLFPLYANSLSNSDLINSANDISTDDRNLLIFWMNGVSVVESNIFIYPRLFRLDNIMEKDNELAFPKLIRCSYDRLESNGVYVLENGLVIFLWLGENFSADWLNTVFGSNNSLMIANMISKGVCRENKLSEQVFSILNQIQSERNYGLKIVVVHQKEAMENWFKRHLIEDRLDGQNASYVDYLCHIHKEVRSLLTG